MISLSLMDATKCRSYFFGSITEQNQNMNALKKTKKGEEKRRNKPL